MARKLVAKVGEYTNRDGEAKGEWVSVGVILEKDNGEFAILKPEISIAGLMLKQRLYNQEQGKKSGKGLMCSIFDEDRGGGGGRQQQSPNSQGAAPVDDDDISIPF